jgi:tetratricopeptide (TPR) repeat protein
VLDEVHAEQARADFLPGLCLEEKVSVSTLPLFLYDLIVRERSGEPVPHVVPGEFGVALSILRQLELRDLERLRSSVQAENEGEAAAASADNEQALRCFKTAITANPYNDVALMSYGCLLANIGHHQKGIPWVEEAVRINPANENAARNLRAMRRGP